MIHERLAVASRIQSQCVKMKEPRDACTCFTVAACHCCKCVQDCRGQVKISVFVLWFYTQHDSLQFLFLPPALSRMHACPPPLLSHTWTHSPSKAAAYKTKMTYVNAEASVSVPFKTHTHTHTHTNTHTNTHTVSGRRSQCGLLQSIQPAGAAGAKWREDSPSVSESVETKSNGSCAADGEANMSALRVKAIPKRVRDMHAASGD